MAARTGMVVGLVVVSFAAWLSCSGADLDRSLPAEPVASSQST